MMALYSPTYQTWETTPGRAKPVEKDGRLGLGINRRRFYAAHSKQHRYTLARYSLDKAYRRKFSVTSLSKLDQYQWAIAAAEMQATIRGDAVLQVQASVMHF